MKHPSATVYTLLGCFDEDKYGAPEAIELDDYQCDECGHWSPTDTCRNCGEHIYED